MSEHQKDAQPSELDPPWSYAYRYPDGVLRMSGGREINGSKPIETIGLYLAPDVKRMVEERIRSAPVEVQAVKGEPEPVALTNAQWLKKRTSETGVVLKNCERTRFLEIVRFAERHITAPPSDAGTRWRHKARGSTYTEIGIGRIQAASWIDLNNDNEHKVDMREVTIYRADSDSTLWVRPREEFEDGRFAALTAPGATTKSDGGASLNDAREAYAALEYVRAYIHGKAQSSPDEMLAVIDAALRGNQSDGGVEGHANAGERRSEETVLGNCPAVPRLSSSAKTSTGRGSGAGVESCPSEPSPPSETAAVGEDTTIGGVTWHSSEEDSGPDVGISVYLGPNDRLWCGEISRRLFDEHDGPTNFDNDGGAFIVRYGPKETTLIAKCADLDTGREFVEQIAAWIRSSTNPIEVSEWSPMEGTPRNGTPINVRAVSTFRYQPYKPNSDQRRKGILGRWQTIDEYGGWNNRAEPQGEWRPNDGLNLTVGARR